MTPCLDISVIIPTWNRRDLLRRTLESFLNQSLPAERFEVIVVDDGSQDGTDVMVRAMQTTVPFSLIYRRMPRNGGPVVARNDGAAQARAAILAFTDSDCEASPQWLSAALAAFSEDPNLGFISGPAVNTPGQRVRFFSVGGADYPGENPTYPAANVIYRKDVFCAVGGFDPSAFFYNAGPTPLDCSDSDLAWRVKERGYRNRFVPDLIIYHAIRNLTPWQWLSHYTRLMTIPELVRRHPGFGRMMLWWGPFCLPENPLFYALVIGVLLSSLSIWFLALAVPFLSRIVYLLARQASLRRLPMLVPQVGFLGLRQVVMCGSLLYGSIRSRTLVL
jgi:glycosyltransferase involved in cell wall biosynthesis